MTNQNQETTASNAFKALQQGKCIEVHHKNIKPFGDTKIYQFKMMTNVDGEKKLNARSYSYFEGAKVWGKWHDNRYTTTQEFGFTVDVWMDGTEESKKNEYFIVTECTLTLQEAMQEVAKTKKDGFIMSENGTIVEVHAMTSGLVRLYMDPGATLKYDDFYLEYVDLCAKWRVM